MSKTLALSLGTLGAGGFGAAGVYYFKNTPESPKETFRTKYSKALIGEDDSIWDSKLSALESSSSNPKNRNLIQAKSEKNGGKKDEAKASLKRGCHEIYSNPVNGSDDFSDFKNFCSFNNKDKIASGHQLVDGEGDFTTHWDTFNSAGKDTLYGGFKEIHDSKGNSADAEGWKGKMLKECKKISEDIFEGEITDFTRFCTKATPTPASEA
ncbi:hypothetical protein HF1_10090 [Mycoplasma haemofelis str. Langford 1]|uniref:Uncharacterized protein n=2 Tax=Mycoplasma haemofelis TaxID=29501 RepID=F6FJJ1_MYCHI|nr:hypothetical protein [Mycoplasma haemofelis]AEG73346.1 hypothetical protein MHF_1098 [Mycoplasma haemofelis Ohio2]CBY93017.1 hypothetical protein HF1_10090 [Mycoplasma haemofelis str. Langford 1]